MAICWETQLKTYNRENNSNIKTVKEMLWECYIKNNKSCHRMAEELLICHNTITDKMRSYGLKLQNRFGNPSVTAKELILKSGLTKEQCRDMTAPEIGNVIGKSHFAARYALDQLGWDWKWSKHHLWRKQKREQRQNIEGGAMVQ